MVDAPDENNRTNCTFKINVIKGKYYLDTYVYLSMKKRRRNDKHSFDFVQNDEIISLFLNKKDVVHVWSID